MLLRCVESFETREGPVPYTVEEGTIWQKTGHLIADGGYELAVLERVCNGRYVGERARVRIGRLTDCFDVEYDVSGIETLFKALAFVRGGRDAHGCDRSEVSS